MISGATRALLPEPVKHNLSKRLKFKERKQAILKNYLAANFYIPDIALSQMDVIRARMNLLLFIVGSSTLS